MHFEQAVLSLTSQCTNVCTCFEHEFACAIRISSHVTSLSALLVSGGKSTIAGYQKYVCARVRVCVFVCKCFNVVHLTLGSLLLPPHTHTQLRYYGAVNAVLSSSPDPEASLVIGGYSCDKNGASAALVLNTISCSLLLALCCLLLQVPPREAPM